MAAKIPFWSHRKICYLPVNSPSMARKSDSDIALATSSSVSLKSKGGIEISVHELQGAEADTYRISESERRTFWRMCVTCFPSLSCLGVPQKGRAGSSWKNISFRLPTGSEERIKSIGGWEYTCCDIPPLLSRYEKYCIEIA